MRLADVLARRFFRYVRITFLDGRDIDDRWYAASVFLRVALTLWLCLRLVIGLVRSGHRTWSLRQVLPSEEKAAQPAGSAPNRS